MAGPGAIREHCVLARATEDVDLLTDRQDAAAFDVAVERVTEDLRVAGHLIEQARRSPLFARLNVVVPDGVQFAVDLQGRLTTGGRHR